MDLSKFKACCDHFISVSDSLSDGWQIAQGVSETQNSFYLKKQLNLVSTLNSQNHQDETDVVENLDLADPSCKASSNPAENITWEYHIAFSESYGVPILYFNCWKNNGSILTFEEILSWTPDEMKPQLLRNRWQSVTQQDHPILGIPFYMLHPCKTAEFLNIVQERSSVNPVVAWLSSFGISVGLSLPLEYGMKSFGEQKEA